MQDYDIRIFNDAGQLSLSVEGQYFSDAAAIHLALKFCRDHESVEVWSGRGRIFAQSPHTSRTTAA